MKKQFFILFFIIFVFFVGLAQFAQASIFSDNFNDGNADGWWLGYAFHYPWIEGSWRVEDIGLPHNGVLVQDNAGDHFRALVENMKSSSQTVETQIKLNDHGSYGGITVWYQDHDTWVNVLIYPANGFINVLEGTIDAKTNNYYYYGTTQNTWYDLKVIADSATGNLDVYLDDVYLFTHTAVTPNRTGLSGVNNGNASVYFDNFKITLNDEVKATTTCGQAVSYGGQSYNTVQIGSQCWFKENLNAGSMI